MVDSSKNLGIVITGRDESGQAFKSATENMTKAGKSAESLSMKLGSLGKNAFNVGKKMSLFATTPIVAMGVMAVKSGAELESLEGSYQRMTDVMGISSDDMLSKMREVSRGTISNKDLILSANKAMSLGVVKNTEDMATIMDIARTKGQTMGLSMTQAFNDLVTGLGRGSAMILDNLGITIKVGEVNEAYAKSIGKTVQELTAEEQKQALVNAVVSQGKEEMEAMGEVQTTSKEKMEALTASITNLKDELGKELLPLATELVSTVTEWASKFSNLDDRTKKMILVALGLVAALGPLLMVIGSLGIAIGGLTTLFALIVSPIGVVVLGIAGLIAIGVLLWKNWDKIKAVGQEVALAFKNTWGELVDWLKEKVDNMIEIFNRIIDKIKEVMSWINKYTSFGSLGVGGLISSAFGGGRASGGFVRSNTSYLVGENGPEIFSPSQNGNIIPNHKLAGSGGITINISGNTLLDRNAGSKIADQIMKQLKLNSRI